MSEFDPSLTPTIPAGIVAIRPVIPRKHDFELIPMKCPQCDRETGRHLTECSECGCQLGFPNVRHAERTEEKVALSDRYKTACDELLSRGCEPVRIAFEEQIRTESRPVICRKWGTIASITDRQDRLFRTFYELVDAGERHPQDNPFDIARQAVDVTFFPYFYKSVNFAALSLNRRGPHSYGDCHFTFSERAISHRTTVFDENTLVFCKRHKIVVGDPPPNGYLATWEDRARLAITKLGSQLTDKTTSADFADILLVQTGKTDTDEFLECHIFGRLAISNVESFWAARPKSKEDQVLASRAKRKLREAGVKVEGP
jgi:hypothetical protein